MKNSNIGAKKTILKMLSKLNDVDSLRTVAEMRYNFEKEINEYEVELKNKETSLIDEFSNVYLSHKSEDGLFGGKELEIFHITSLEFEAYSTDYEKVYKCKGERIGFNNINVNKGPLNSYFRGLTEKEIRSYKVITKSEYDKYVMAYEKMSKDISQIIEE